MLMVLASPQDTQTAEMESAKPEEPCPQATENSSAPKSREGGEQPSQEPAATTVTNTTTVADFPANANAATDGNNNNTLASVLPPVPSTQTETATSERPQPLQTDPVLKPPLGLGGIHESFATLNGGLPQTPGALSHLPANFLSSHTTIWPPRSYLPESCYTLPLPRDLCARAAQGGLTESHAPNEGEQGAGDIKPEHPMDGHHTLGGPQFFRQPHDLFRDLPKMRLDCAYYNI